VGVRPISLFAVEADYLDLGSGRAGAQVRVGNVGARLAYENFNIPNTSGAQVISLGVILRL
jgi:hypothetical protein